MTTIRILLACLVLVVAMPPVSVRAADEHAAGHGHLGMPEPGSEATKPSELRSDLAIYSFVIFILLIVILGKFAWGPIAQALDAREQHIAGDIAAARRSNEEAKRLLAQYEARLTAAQEEVRSILDQGRRSAGQLQEEMLAKARADATAEMDRAKREIELARDQALQQLAEKSANLAVDLAGKIVQAKLNAADHAQLINDAVGRLAPNMASRN